MTSIEKEMFAPFCTNLPRLCAKKIQRTHGAPRGNRLSIALATVFVQVFLCLGPTEIAKCILCNREAIKLRIPHKACFLRLTGSSIPMTCEC